MSDETNGRPGARADRRKFLKDVMVVGGAVAVGVAAKGALAGSRDPEPVKPKGKVTDRGYHVTPHIEEYYRCADRV